MGRAKGMQNGDRKRSNRERCKDACVYVAVSYPHNRLAVHEEEESFFVTQHGFDPSLFPRGGGSPLKHLGPLALRPPTFQTFVSVPTDSMLVDDR